MPVPPHVRPERVMRLGSNSSWHVVPLGKEPYLSCLKVSDWVSFKGLDTNVKALLIVNYNTMYPDTELQKSGLVSLQLLPSANRNNYKWKLDIIRNPLITNLMGFHDAE